MEVIVRYLSSFKLDLDGDLVNDGSNLWVLILGFCFDSIVYLLWLSSLER